MALDTSETTDTIADNVRGTRDALSVKRAFGDAYELDGQTFIPVARVAGGAGGGGGSGESPDKGDTGSGFGTGFGLGAQPVGLYEIRDGEAMWKPAVDVNRIVKGGQILTGVLAVCATLAYWIRNR